MKAQLKSKPYFEISEVTDNIPALFSDLVDNSDDDTRQWAGTLLVKIGPRVLPQLNMLLGSTNRIIRLETIKIINLIGHPSSIPILITSLEDPEREIRLIAVDGLIHIGRSCMTPLLKKLAERPASTHLKFTAHRILTALINRKDPKNIRNLVLLLKPVNDELLTIQLKPVTN